MGEFYYNPFSNAQGPLQKGKYKESKNHKLGETRAK